MGGGGLLMSLVIISKPVVSRIEEEVMSLMVIYYCICAFLCHVTVSTHLCVICCHFCCPLSLFQGYLGYQILPYIKYDLKNGVQGKKEGFTALYKNPNTFLTFWFLNANWVKKKSFGTVESPLTATSVKWYIIITASFFWPCKTGIRASNN